MKNQLLFLCLLASSAQSAERPNIIIIMVDDMGHPSYQGYLNDRCVTIAEALKPVGYFTAICGKWHVGSDPEHWPLKRGFARFYGTPQGGGHHYRNLPGRDLVLNDKVISVAGRSLRPALTGEAIERPEGIYFEHQGNAAVRDGKWKLVRVNRKLWELYDLQADRTELNDLSKQYPERASEMQGKWQAWAERVGAQPWPIKKK